MSTNVQVFPMFDGVNIAADSGFVSELEDMLRELLIFFIVNMNFSDVHKPGSGIYEYICRVFD